MKYCLECTSLYYRAEYKKESKEMFTINKEGFIFLKYLCKESLEISININCKKNVVSHKKSEKTVVKMAGEK